MSPKALGGSTQVLDAINQTLWNISPTGVYETSRVHRVCTILHTATSAYGLQRGSHLINTII